MDTTRNGSAAAVPRRPRPKPPRVLRWVLKPTLETPYGILRVAEGGPGKEEIDHYFLQALPCEIGGRAFLWTKLVREGEEASVYHVRLDSTDPKRSTCECKGFLRWGRCRHIEASTSQLDQMPELPATPTKTE